MKLNRLLKNVQIRETEQVYFCSYCMGKQVSKNHNHSGLIKEVGNGYTLSKATFFKPEVIAYNLNFEEEEGTCQECFNKQSKCVCEQRRRDLCKIKDREYKCIDNGGELPCACRLFPMGRVYIKNSWC